MISLNLIYGAGVLVICGVFFYIDKKNRLNYDKNIKILDDKIDSLQQKIDFNKAKSKEQLQIEHKNFINLELKKRNLLESENKKLKRILDDTKVIAQDASMVKTDFLTNVKHEIRTPMNSILVFAEMLEKGVKDQQLSTFASNIKHSGNALLTLLNNILELSEIESGNFKIDESGVEVESFFRTEIDIYQKKARKKGLKLSLEIAENMPQAIMIDQVRVNEILNNLIENGIKFTDFGEVKVIVKQLSFDKIKNTADIVVIVEDTGVGIAKENQDKIFKIFENRQNANEIEYQGAGLGLSINRKLAQLMGGSLEVQSTISKGSKFILTLKNVEVVLSSLENSVDESNIDFSIIKSDSSIAIIDDSKDSLDTTIESFSKTKIEVLVFDNARDAIGILQKRDVDLILINIDFLTMDNGAVSKVLKKIGDFRVVSLVNHRLKDIEFVENGVIPIAHIKKPIKKVDLFTTIFKILNSQTLIVNNGNLELNEDDELNFEANIENSKLYFEAQKKTNIEKFLDTALKTNDLTTIEKFASQVNILSKKYSIKSLTIFSKELTDKVEAFDIKNIGDMLKEYKLKADEFQKRI